MATAASYVATRVKRIFGDEAGVQVTDADIYMWLTDAQREAVVQNANLLQKRTPGTTVAGSVNVTIPPDLIELAALYVEGSKLRYLSVQEMDLLNVDWRGDKGAKGRPVAFTRMAGEFYFYPIPDTAYSYSILHSYEPSTISAATDVLVLPSTYINYCIEYCLMKAYEMDEDWEAAAAKASIVQSTLDALNARDTYFGKDFYPKVTEVN